MAASIAWVDELWDEYDGSHDPQYRLVNNRLEFLNPINRAGTLHNAENMNALVDFDNPSNFPGCRITTVFTENGMTSEYRRMVGNALVADRSVNFNTMIENQRLYNTLGQVVQNRTIPHIFGANTITIEVNV